MSQIWPERIVPLPQVSRVGREPWLGDDKVAQVLGIVTNGYTDMLDKPVVLDNGAVRQIAPVLLGGDPMGGERVLYLRVTNERFYEVGPQIKLTLVSYDSVGRGDRKRIRPGMAGDILDEFVEQLKAVPGLALEDLEEECQFATNRPRDGGIVSVP
jgi:hypothetical protein